MEDVLVSVLLCIYNEPFDYIQSSVESMIGQTYKNMELIIVIDSPKRPDIVAYLMDIEKKDSRVKVIINSVNFGLAKSLNIGLAYATGKYIARMDADDISFPKRIENQLRLMEESDYGMLGSWINQIDQEGELIKANIAFPVSEHKIIRYANVRSPIAHPTWMVKREIYDSLGGYREYFGCEDYDFVLRALQCGIKIGMLSEVLLNYRINPKGISVSNLAEIKLFAYYLNHQFRKHPADFMELDNNAIRAYKEGRAFQCEFINLSNYLRKLKIVKDSLKNRTLSIQMVVSLFSICFSKYFYKGMKEHYIIKQCLK